MTLPLYSNAAVIAHDSVAPATVPPIVVVLVQMTVGVYLGGAPQPVMVDGGARVVEHALPPEREHAPLAGVGPAHRAVLPGRAVVLMIMAMTFLIENFFSLAD